MTPPGEEELLQRIIDTDVEDLRRAGAAFDAAADECERIRLRAQSVGVELETAWLGSSGSAFRHSLTQLHHQLATVAPALSTMAEALRDHARITEEAKRAVALASTATAKLYSAGSLPDQAALQDTIQAHSDAATQPFHASEQRVRKILWDLGAQAPGDLPIPELPPPPPQPLWEKLLFGFPMTDARWMPSRVGGPPIGVDEDGAPVPAYAADPIPNELALNGAAPVEPILKWLSRLGKVGEGLEGVEALTAVKRVVQESHGWRPGHIDKHIREFFNLADKAEVPQWARDEFLDAVAHSASNPGTFRWKLKSPRPNDPNKTYATLWRDPATKKFLVTQWYAEGDRVGEFATAIVPTVRQLTEMLSVAART